MEEPSFDVDGTKLNKSLVLTFQNWVLTQPNFSPIYKKFSTPLKSIIPEVLSLIPDTAPISFHLWWSVNHGRYARLKIDSQEVRDFHMIITQFLCYFVTHTRRQGQDHGRANTVHSEAKQEIGPDPKHSADRVQRSRKFKKPNP